jgi:hypothetical protein
MDNAHCVPLTTQNSCCLDEFGEFGLAWRRIVDRIIVEELWKHLVNVALAEHVVRENSPDPCNTETDKVT